VAETEHSEVHTDEIHSEGTVSTTSRGLGAGPQALVIALVFLGGAFGYFFGVRGSKTLTSAVDTGFMVDMSEHHDQAVQIAIMELAHGEDMTVKGFAQDVLLFQRSELGAMSVLLDDHGASRPEYDPHRTVMAWMNMSTELQSMPGLASPDQLTQLEAARGSESDLLFLTLMSTHHTGGLHMAQYASEHGSDPRVTELAGRMATNQAAEVKEYNIAQERLGVPVATTEPSGSGSMASMPGMSGMSR